MYQFSNGTLKVALVSELDDYLDDFYWRHTMSGSITESLEPIVPTWSHQNGVFICAQPGRGKTTFIKEEIIPAAIEKRKNVLLLSSRLANSVQQKRLIAQKLGLQTTLEGLSEIGLQRHTDFGSVKIMTYQSVQGFLNDPDAKGWIRNCAYLVCDECHFFAVDALFNFFAGSALRNLVCRFSHAVRIYMTATPYDVQRCIAAAERDEYSAIQDFACNERIFTCDRYIEFYNFPVDYSAYCVDFIREYEDVIPKIEENPDEKWLIFCENKQKGMLLKNRLCEVHQIRAAYLDADSKESKEWEKLCREERFDEQVMLCTTVLDCGVNIHDKKLGHIVLAADNQTTFIQCIGRKRLDSNETLQVHVLEINPKTLVGRRASITRKLNLAQKFDAGNHLDILDMMANTSDPDCSALFRYASDAHYRKGGGVFKSKEAEYVLRRRKDFYERMSSDKATYREEVARWLGNTARITEENHVLQIEKFYAAHKNVALTDDEKGEFKNLVFAYAASIGIDIIRESRKGASKEVALNHILEDARLPFVLSRQWVLRKFEEETT